MFGSRHGVSTEKYLQGLVSSLLLLLQCYPLIISLTFFLRVGHLLFTCLLSSRGGPTNAQANATRDFLEIKQMPDGQVHTYCMRGRPCCVSRAVTTQNYEEQKH